MNYDEILDEARGNMGPWCKACPICDGVACGNQIPGPGAKGSGDVAIRNYRKWQEIRINMDTIYEKKEVSTKFKLFGEEYDYPIFAGPVGDMKRHYGDKYDNLEYNDILIKGCADAGIAAFTGDGLNPGILKDAANAIGNAGGKGIPTIKPWSKKIIFEKIDMVKAAGARAIAMDIDAAGLPFLKDADALAGPKSIKELKEIISYAGIPFIIKGIMTVRGAEKAIDSGAAGIIVSNHGGRVLDQTPATAEVLDEIVHVTKDYIKVLVDGGIRSGADVFKALAMGADAVLIARPFVTAVYGGGEKGIKAYADKIGGELADTMAMCGATDLKGIRRHMIRF